MRYARDIQVAKLILHSLDHLNSSEPLLSEAELPLEEHPRLEEYFSVHIENSLQDKAARAALFQLPNPTAEACFAIFEDADRFVALSQELARLLFNAIGGDRRVASGDLAVCTFSAVNRPSITYLGLLKIDPSEVFTRRVIEDDEGRQIIILDVLGNAMPTTREKLHKCAFIQPIEDDLEYHMILLDRQVRPIADFFARGFLSSTYAYDNLERTKRFYKAALGASNILRKDRMVTQAEIVSINVAGAVRAAEIDVDQWLASLPLTQDQRDLVDQEISKILPDRHFEVDPAYVERYLRPRRKFRGDRGLTVQARADAFGDVVKEPAFVDDEGRPPFYRIVIETEEWTEEI